MTPYYDKRGCFLGYTHHFREIFNIEGRGIGCFGYPGVFNNRCERVGWVWHQWLLDLEGLVMAVEGDAPDALIPKPIVRKPNAELKRFLERPIDFAFVKEPMPGPFFEWSDEDPSNLLATSEPPTNKTPAVFYSRKGKPVAFTTHWKTIFSIWGDTLGHIHGKALLNPTGQHVGWLNLGWILDLNGKVIAFERGAPGSLRKPLIWLPKEWPKTQLEEEGPILKASGSCPLIRARWSVHTLKSLLKNQGA